MNDKNVTKDYLEALNLIARFTEKGNPLREEAVKLLRRHEEGQDLSKYMRNVRFQCLKCKEVFGTEKEYRIHAGMNKYCGGVSPEESDYKGIGEQLNVLRPGP